MFLRVRRVFSPLRRRIRKYRFIAAGGSPASWYDGVYSGTTGDYVGHYSQSRYILVWEDICSRIPKGASILEIGCGPGQLAAMILDRVIPRDYVGFDFSPAAIELARKNLPGRRLEVADARTTSLFETVDYDTVVCTEVLEHIVDDLLVIKRIPKGKRVLATVPNFDYVSHVRFFANASAVRARYGKLFESLEIREHRDEGESAGSQTFFIMIGVR